MFLSRNKKNKVYPCEPKFYYIKVGFKGVKIIYACFHDVTVFYCTVVTAVVRYMYIKSLDKAVFMHELKLAMKRAF